MINYYLLTKPGIIFGNLVTMAAGFLLAANGHFDFFLFIETLIGLTLIIASACIFNNYLDRHIDQKMERTKNRPFVKGMVKASKAILLAVVLVTAGNFILLYYTNMLATIIADIGFLIYIGIYTVLKTKTIYGTAIGSIAGAIPPIVGYCAVSNHLDAGAFILFAILVFWQMAHFFSIAIYRIKDYSSAEIPILPLEKGIPQTKFHIFLYIIAFWFALSALTALQYTGLAYLVIGSCLALAWLIYCLTGFRCQNNQIWGKRMFAISLVVIIGLCLIISVDVRPNVT